MTQTVLFEDIVAVKIDNRGKTPPVVDSGYPLLEVNAISRNRLYPDISKVSKFVDKETRDTWFRQHLEKDDILFTTVGTIAESAIIPSDSNAVVAQNILGFRFKKDIVNPLFVLYLMRSKWFLDQIGGRTVETVQKSIKWADMRGIKLELPEINEQKKIADILGTIDEKIELNRKMNETLEQMGQALFRHYFIDNPDAEKWEDGNISMFADNVRDSVNPPFPNSTRYVALEHFTPRTLALYESMSASNATSNKSKFKKNDILFGKLRPYFHKVAVAPFDGVCSTDVLVVRPKETMYFSYVSFFMSQKVLIDYTTQASEGTRMPRTSWANICNYQVALPPYELPEKFNEQASVLIEQIMDNSEQIQTLTILRDTLLPRLINGKVKI